jgi:tryptophan synthase alpha chain
MSRYERIFRRLSARREGAFVPFVVVGDPDPDTSLAVMRALARAGADALELGLPFSDPVADGPVIQAAAGRALANGMTPSRAWPLLATIRAEFPDLPMGLLVYANLVIHRGPDHFYRAAALAGVDSVLVADLPLQEADPLIAAARAHGISPIFIAPPNASEERLDRIAAASEGYVYVTSRPGVTGADRELHHDSARVMTRLRTAGSPPPLLGFGIAEPRHVRQALTLGAAGAISGSAVVKRMSQNSSRTDGMLRSLTEFTREMKRATLAEP